MSGSALSSVPMNRVLRMLPSRWGWLSKERAIEVAGQAAADRGLPWRDPVAAYRHFGNWDVWSPAGQLGGQVRVIVDGGSGAVLLVAGPAPR
jgi:hypothetical protein